MTRLARIAALWLPLAAVAAMPGCHAHRGTQHAADTSPIAVGDLDDFERALNRYALLEEGSPARAEQRALLQGFLTHYLDAQLAAGDEEEAISAMRYSASLYQPGELRDDRVVAPEFGAMGQALYRHAARRGAERPSFLALAVIQRFGDEAARARAVEQWATLEEWVVRNGPFASEPLLRHEELERALDDVAATLPTPFVVRRVADLYLARYEAAKSNRQQDAGTAARHRMDVTGYLLMRLHLRADDVAGARAAMARVELDMPVAKLGELMDDAYRGRRNATAMLAFAEQFAPDPDADGSDPYIVQGWGIVDNLSRRAVAAYPKDAYVQLLRARTLRNAGLGAAAMEYLRRALAIKEDIFAAWQELAQLEQRDLERVAARDPAAAADRLPRIEALHTRATKLWADRPIRPGMPEAFFTVAEGLYEAGEAKRAEALLQRSVGIEPVPNSLDLLGTIALKQSKLAEAQSRYEDLANLPYDNELTQLQWEARARQQLGEIALRRGDTADGTKHIRIALRHTNDLLARPTEDPDARAARLVERGKLLFYLGDTKLAMTDFADAAQLAPDDVKVYADPLIAMVPYGYLDEARTIYRSAMARRGLPGSLKLYFSLWLVELANRQGRPVDPDAEQFIASYRGSGWAKLLAAHARGDITFEALVQGARDRGQRAEAYFYEALARWDAGQHEPAKGLLRKVIASGMMGFFEYDMAQAYLGWNDLPQVARAPLSPRTKAPRGSSGGLGRDRTGE